MDKQGATISAKIWYIRQEAVIFFFFFCLPHYHMLGEVEEIKKWIFCCCFRHGTLWLGLGFTFLCSALYHKESWKFEISGRLFCLNNFGFTL